MSDTKIPAAVIGLGSSGRAMLDVLMSCDLADVVGISDTDRRLVETVGTEKNVPHFSDNRQMILQTSPRAVFIATPPRAAPELMKFCASRKIAVWKDGPLARNLGEAASFVRLFDKATVPLVVGSQRRFTGSYIKLRELKKDLGRIFLTRAHCIFNLGGELGWRGDKVSSGGGSLLDPGFHMVDLLVWTLGFPDEVYGVSTCIRPGDSLDTTRRGYDTDDTASAILQYSDDSVASLATSRVSGPYHEQLVVCGRGGSLYADETECIYRDPAGEEKEKFQEEMAGSQIKASQAESFLRAVRDDSKFYPSPAAESMLVHAVIDSIYLACRTCQPENPDRQLQVHGIEFSECMAHTAVEKKAF